MCDEPVHYIIRVWSNDLLDGFKKWFVPTCHDKIQKRVYELETIHDEVRSAKILVKQSTNCKRTNRYNLSLASCIPPEESQEYNKRPSKYAFFAVLTTPCFYF
jgi:hypothetical protein